jgi:hypothetical protein
VLRLIPGDTEGRKVVEFDWKKLKAPQEVSA